MYAHHLVHRMKLAQERFNTNKADIRRRYQDLYDKTFQDIDIKDGNNTLKLCS